MHFTGKGSKKVFPSTTDRYLSIYCAELTPRTPQSEKKSASLFVQIGIFKPSIGFPMKRIFTAIVVVFSFVYSQNLFGQCGTNTQSGTVCNRAPNGNSPSGIPYLYGTLLPNAGCGVFNATPNNFGPGQYFQMPVLAGGCYSVSTCGSSIDTQLSCFQGTATTSPFAYNDDNGPICGGLQASVDITPSFTDYTRVQVREYNCQVGGSASVTVNVRQNNNLNITSAATAMCEGQTRTLAATPASISGTLIAGSGDRGTFIGAGVSGTTFTAPTPSGASQTFTITYTFGYCTTTQNILVHRAPTTAAAGPNQNHYCPIKPFTDRKKSFSA